MGEGVGETNMTSAHQQRGFFKGNQLEVTLETVLCHFSPAVETRYASAAVHDFSFDTILMNCSGVFFFFFAEVLLCDGKQDISLSSSFSLVCVMLIDAC